MADLHTFPFVWMWMSVYIEFELKIFSLLVLHSLTAEYSCVLMWLPVVEPCGDWFFCQLSLHTGTLLVHRASISYPTYRKVQCVLYSTHISSKSGQFVLLPKSRESNWSQMHHTIAKYKLQYLFTHLSPFILAIVNQLQCWHLFIPLSLLLFFCF